VRHARLAALLLLACATPQSNRAPELPRPFEPEPVRPDELAPDATFLVPNFRDADGTPAYVHFTPEQMPIRVSVSAPFDAPEGGTPADARRAVVYGISLWQQAIEDELPWFRLEFVDDERNADLRIGWRRTMTSGWKAETRCRIVFLTTLAVGCHMDIAIARQPAPMSSLGIAQSPDSLVERQTVTQILNQAAHEFGHVLGLRHCACDSIMNASEARAPRPEIREIDRRTLLALMAIPNGQRIDGRRLGTAAD
jgi:hypothetical protein